MAYLGFDTSNYTTSAALFFPEENRVVQKKLLLPVKKGERGLRQSDAVFHHTVQLSDVFSRLMKENGAEIEAVCASVKPCPSEKSYMPCFLVGKNTGICSALTAGVPFFETTHQHGHIAAALFSAERLDLLNRRFLAFHLSGGTTQALLVEPNKDEILSITQVASSLDLKAGQAVDRVGLMLGLDFPCGAQLDLLAQKSEKRFKIKPSMKGTDCSLSGVENKCKMMIEKGESPCDVARFCIEFISASLEAMTQELLREFGNLPPVFSGGVMSNSIISSRFKDKYGAIFAKPEFSCDNAAGVAVIGSLKGKMKTERSF